MDWFTFAIVIGLLLVSAFFSGSETALTAASRASMLRLTKQGNREAGVVTSLMAMRERMIGALLLGNNIGNIGASVLATGVFTAWFGEVGVLYATGCDDGDWSLSSPKCCRRPLPSTRLTGLRCWWRGR